ncbi:MAG: ferrous iron transporter B [Clostridia bacterium]|nr:ferrous iron transporter B [Clostridia bacterium]
MNNEKRVVALCGNPNVGKSTVFNALTGLKQHTGNWAGKTVELSYGKYEYNDAEYTVVDLPGTYSFSARSHEEKIARDFICSNKADVVVVVCDATSLERNLNIVFRTMELSDKVIVAVNLLDEAQKKHIDIDLDGISKMLRITVVGMSARSGKGIEELKCAVEKAINEDGEENQREKEQETLTVNEIYERAREICGKYVKQTDNRATNRQLKADRLLTNKYFGIPVMLAGLALILWITVSGANYPSQVLSSLLLGLEDEITSVFEFLHMPLWLTQMLTEGGYRVLAWVVSVMLPPMAIFFPLFTLLEDAGYLPRVAFNLDGCFKHCCACGKQALTMCMGFGCNAVGVVGCRIIDSKRERLIAIVTNCFMPCNGRFPTLIAIITMFFVGSAGGLLSSVLSSLMLVMIIVCGVLATFWVSKLLSKTLLKGIPSSFTLELPPYRRPQFGKVIVRSIFDRTLLVLSRAACVAFPAGIVLWIMANVNIGETTLFAYCTAFLDPFAKIIGLDGVILLAFILALPANEIVMPIIIMGYMASGTISQMPNLSQLHGLLVTNGWNMTTAICTMLFSLFHWPCSTTLLTVKKETGSLIWTLASAVIPTLLGIVVCAVVTLVFRIIA